MPPFCDSRSFRYSLIRPFATVISSLKFMYVDVACQCIISLWRVSVVRLYFHSYHWICNAIFKEAPNKSQIEKDEEAKRHHQAMATWTTQREKNLFEQYIKPTLTPLNGIENELITVANGLIKEYRKERESQKVAYYKTIAIVILSSLLLISILIIRLV